MKANRVTPFSVALSAVLAGCNPPSSDRLGRIEVSPSCAALDRVCLEQGFDAPIATGATQPVSLEFWIPATAPPPVSLTSVDPDRFAIDGRRVTALTEGTSALLVESPDGTVLDFIHLWAVQPQSLQLVGLTGVGTDNGVLEGRVQLRVGDQLSVRVEPRIDDAGLLGEFPTEFIVEGDAVTILSSATGQYTIETLQEGTATLRASALELGVELEVEVLP